MRQLLPITFSLALLTACSHGIKSVEPKEFEKTLDDKTITCLDVRTAKEYSEGHIAGAINIDVKSKNFEQEVLEALPESGTVAVYCKGGVRSMKAAKTIAKHGYQIVNLKKGFDSWKEYQEQKNNKN